MIQSVSATFTGNGTNIIGSRLRGKILAVKTVADANVSANWDIALTGQNTGIPILTDTAIGNNATEWFHPRALASKVADGSAATDDFVCIPLYNEGIKCVTTNAGTTGEITVTVIYDADV